MHQSFDDYGDKIMVLSALAPRGRSTGSTSIATIHVIVSYLVMLRSMTFKFLQAHIRAIITLLVSIVSMRNDYTAAPCTGVRLLRAMIACNACQLPATNLLLRYISP